MRNEYYDDLEQARRQDRDAVEWARRLVEEGDDDDPVLLEMAELDDNSLRDKWRLWISLPTSRKYTGRRWEKLGERRGDVHPTRKDALAAAECEFWRENYGKFPIKFLAWPALSTPDDGVLADIVLDE
jgi:hypothetical protein